MYMHTMCSRPHYIYLYIYIYIYINFSYSLGVVTPYLHTSRTCLIPPIWPAGVKRVQLTRYYADPFVCGPLFIHRRPDTFASSPFIQRQQLRIGSGSGGLPAAGAYLFRG